MTTKPAIQISYQDLPPSPSLERAIRSRAAKLAERHRRITDCRIALSRPHRRGRRGHLFQVRIELSVPGDRDIVVSRGSGEDRSHEDVYVAIRDAFDAASRQLHDHAERARV